MNILTTCCCRKKLVYAITLTVQLIILLIQFVLALIEDIDTIYKVAVGVFVALVGILDSSQFGIWTEFVGPTAEDLV